MCIYFNKENSKESPKFKVGDHVIISKQKNISAKSCIPSWWEEVFDITEIKNILAVEICY